MKTKQYDFTCENCNFFKRINWMGWIRTCSHPYGKNVTPAHNSRPDNCPLNK